LVQILLNRCRRDGEPVFAQMLNSAYVYIADDQKVMAGNEEAQFGAQFEWRRYIGDALQCCKNGASKFDYFWLWLLISVWRITRFSYLVRAII